LREPARSHQQERLSALLRCSNVSCRPAGTNRIPGRTPGSAPRTDETADTRQTVRRHASRRRIGRRAFALYLVFKEPTDRGSPTQRHLPVAIVGGTLRASHSSPDLSSLSASPGNSRITRLEPHRQVSCSHARPQPRRPQQAGPTSLRPPG
jgi:hypothetical protein